MRALWVLTIVLLSGCATSGPWTENDTRREIAWQVLNAADAVTTAQIQYDDGLVEKAPVTRAILGSEPGSAETALYFSTLAVSHWVISRLLPATWRPYWQTGTSAYALALVVTNCRNGLCR